MMKYQIIGKNTPSISSWDKVTGRAQYTDDITIKNPLIIKILRSPLPSAVIKNIDMTDALAVSGVRGIITGEDIPNTFGVLPISKDEPALAQSQVRYVGEPIAAVAADTAEQALLALKKIEVTFKETAPVLKMSEAYQNTANPIHPELKKGNNLHKHVEQSFGNLQKGFKNSDVIIEEEFEFPSVTHAFTEPHATQVEIDYEGNLTVISATQVPHYLHRALSYVLEIPLHKIRVIKPHLGGGFGGKSDPFPHEIIATKLALLLKRNTKIMFSREEVFFSHHGRHPSKIKMKIGVSRKDGISALDAKISIDGGAYGSFGVVTTYYNGVLLNGPYHLPNLAFSTDRFYTNKPMCGAMRGHGGVNPRFASEVTLDMALNQLDIDPCEFRIKNFLKPNTITPNEFRVTSVGIKNALKKAMGKSKWKEKYKKLPLGQGIGVAAGFFISGSALPIHWNKMPQTTVRLTIDFDGSVTIYSGASDIGQGSDTMLAQIVGEVLGVPLTMIKVISADTRLCPIDLGSYSSRVTFMCGNAARNAAIRMRKILVAAACQLLKIDRPKYVRPKIRDAHYFAGGELRPNFAANFLGPNPDYKDGFTFKQGKIRATNGVTINYSDVMAKALENSGCLETKGIYISPKMGGKFKGAGAGLSPAYSMSAFITEVSVDLNSGFLKVDKVTAVHDCGTPLNPLSVEGQIEGSIHMGLGQALMEQLTYTNGAINNASFLDYKIPSPYEQPEIDIVLAETADNEGPYGAKEVGEGSLAPFIPSIANALFDAVGVRLTTLPLTPDKIYQAMKK